jgi:subtilase family serine protease
MRRPSLLVPVLTIVLGCAVVPALAASPKAGSLSPRLGEGKDLGRSPASARHEVVVSLDLHDRAELEEFLVDVQDPISPRYHQFLTQEEFNARYAPTPDEEAAVVDHLRRGGLKVTGRFSNRLLVGAVGSVAALERTFGVEIHDLDVGGRRHFATTVEPSLPSAIAGIVTGVLGLDDLSERHPHVHGVMPAAAPHAALGANCCSLSPNDLFTFYDQPGSLSGAGQTIVIAGAYAWLDTDNTGFNNQWGLPQLPAGSGQVCTGSTRSSGCKFSSSQSIEIALDVEYAHGVAPGARIVNYMSTSTSNASFTTM